MLPAVLQHQALLKPGEARPASMPAGAATAASQAARPVQPAEAPKGAAPHLAQGFQQQPLWPPAQTDTCHMSLSQLCSGGQAFAENFGM